MDNPGGILWLSHVGTCCEAAECGSCTAELPLTNVTGADPLPLLVVWVALILHLIAGLMLVLYHWPTHPKPSHRCDTKKCCSYRSLSLNSSPSSLYLHLPPPSPKPSFLLISENTRNKQASMISAKLLSFQEAL